MKTVILAGGRGTRLRPYSVVFPKPLVPIGDKPILEIILAQLRRAGARDVTVSVGHLAELLMAFFGDGAKLGLSIRYVREDQPLGTVGPLHLVPDLPDDFLLMNGDILTDLDYGALFSGHVTSGAALSIATYKKSMHVDLGVLESEGARVTAYFEKPTYVYEVSTGVYAVKKSVLGYVPRGEYFDFPMLVTRLLAAGEFVRSVPHDGIWLDIGRPADYDEALSVFADKRDRLDAPC
jgi:NDP-sugar pyrophosphorylase family protein